MSVATMLRKEKDGTLYKYTKIGGVKLAEPPPPDGVSVKEWDRILQAGAKRASEGRMQARLQHLYRRRGLDENGRMPKTAAQDPDKNKDGYKLQGRENFQGLPIAIENDKGSVRKGKNEDGSSWETKFKTPYGYIEGTRGADGDEIDAYVGPDKKSTKAFVVHQKKDDGSHDEDTVMLGFRSASEAKKDILNHYDTPKNIGSVTPIEIEVLRKKVMPGKKIEKIAAPAVDYRESDNPQMTGKPALRKRKKGELPSRDDMSTYPKAENRQDSQGTKLMDAFHAAEGTDDSGKFANSKLEAASELLGLGVLAAPSVDDMIAKQRAAKAGALNRRGEISEHKLDKFRVIKQKFHSPAEVTGLGVLAAPMVPQLLSKRAEALGLDRALGDQRKGWEGPTRETMAKSREDKHRGPGGGFVQLTDVSTSVAQDESKTSSTPLGMALAKLGSRGLPRRKQPEESRYEPYEATRGESIQSLVAGAAPTDGYAKAAMVDELQLLNAVTEEQAKVAAPVTKEQAEKSMKRLKKLEESAPGAGEISRGALVGGAVGPVANLAWRAAAGKRARMGHPIWMGIRPQAAHAAHGAVFGGLLPAGRHRLEQEAEKQTLREYVGEHRRGTLRGRIRKTLGV